MARYAGASDGAAAPQCDRCAEASADGRWIAVRTKDEAVFYRTDELLHGDVEHGTAVSLAEFAEPQGEGITFGAGIAVYLAGEGGGKGAPGTFLRLECSFRAAAAVAPGPL